MVLFGLHFISLVLFESRIRSALFYSQKIKALLIWNDGNALFLLPGVGGAGRAPPPPAQALCPPQQDRLPYKDSGLGVSQAP